MKRIKTDGLEGAALKFANEMNAVLEALPEGQTPEQIQKAINDAFEAQTGEKGKFKVAMDAAIKTITDDTVEGSLAHIVKSQGAQIAALKETIQSGIGNGENGSKTLVDALGIFVDAFKTIKAQKTGVFAFELASQKGGKNLFLKAEKEMVEKAAATQTVAGTVTNSISTATGLRLGDGPIFEIKRGRPFILDFVNVGQTDAPFYIWWDETPKQGDFAVTAEGVMKPQVEYQFTRKSSDYKKIAGYIVLTDEFMMDLPGLVTAIKRLANIDLMNDINAAVLTDMIAALPGFTYAGLNGSIYHADDYAAIGAAITQIQSLFFQPTVLVLNPADSWKMKLTKDDVGRYQMPPFAFNGETFEFGQVITDPRVANGHFLVGDGSTWNVDFRGGLQVRIGYNGTDFIQNQQTLLIEQYYYDFISANRVGAWVYGNFSVIKGVINDTTNS